MDNAFVAVDDFVRQLVGGWGQLTALVAILGAALFALRFLVIFWRSYRLLRLFHIGEVRGTRLSALSQLLLTILRKPITIVSSRSLFKRTRMRVEYEAIKPRPKRFIEPVGLPQSETYEAQMDRWRSGLSDLFKDSSNETIVVNTPQHLHSQFEDVDRYFDSLEQLQLDKREMQFVTKIKIKTGFAAPLHLIAGVLRKFDEDWETVLSTYERDRADFSAIVPPATQKALEPLREIQLFIFDCWLLWGPSIPICDQHCSQFAGSWSSLQYGFGDENNSVEIVGLTEFLTGQWSKLAPPPGVRAVSASVLGHIANSRFLDADEAEERMGRGLAHSWNSDDDGRLLVRVSEEQHKRTADTEAHETREVRISDTGAITRGNPDTYYSAYLWSIFVVLREQPGAATLADRAWVPVHSDPNMPRRSTKPWLDFLSFFEHGNIADQETYVFLKRQLAEKAISGIAKLVLENRVGAEAEAAVQAYPLRFAFACSIDEAGCGHDLRFEPHGVAASGFRPDSLPDLMHRQVRERFPMLEGLILFDYYGKSVHPHSACNLPRDISGFFEHVEG